MQGLNQRLIEMSTLPLAMCNLSLMHIHTLCAGRVVLNTITVLGKCIVSCDLLFKNSANFYNSMLILLITGI